MRKAILFFYSLLFISCACYYEDVRQEGEMLNPTSYVYDFPEMEVRRVLLYTDFNFRRMCGRSIGRV